MRRQLKAPSAGSTWATGSDRGLKGYAFAAILIAFGLILLGSARAEAATTYESSGSIGGEGLANPSDLAIDEATGNVLVVDREHNRVAVYGSSGPGASLLTEFGAGELSLPYGIATDPSSGDVYVSDAGNSRIVKYVSDGGSPPAYSLDPTFTSPPIEGAGGLNEFTVSMAVDPTSGDLLIADFRHRSVNRYAADGGFISAFGGNAVPIHGHGFETLIDIAVDGEGTIYVLDLAGGFNSIFGQIFGSSQIWRFSGTGAFEGQMSAEGMPEETRSLASDPSNGNVIATLAGGSERSQAAYVFRDGTFLDKVTFPGGSAESAVVATAAGGPDGRLYALTNSVLFETIGTTGVQVFDPVTIPDVEIEAPNAVTPTGAHLQGTINPLGQPTSYRFEYLAEGSTAWAETATAEVGSGEAPVSVSADISGLQPNAKYRIRLVAVTATRNVQSAPLVFSTPPSSPSAITDAPASVTVTAAEFRGQVNPFGQQTGYHFEYGTTTAYGNRAPAKVDAVAGNGRVLKAVAAGITGLSPDTTYHFRLVAQNATGTSAGGDVAFTTGSASAPRRAYEQVTPVEKNGMVPAPNSFYRASASGNSFLTRANAAANQPDTEGVARFIWYLSNRGAGGWSFLPLDLPQSPMSGTLIAATSGVSEDGSKALVISNRKLTPDSIEGGANLYLRDTATGHLQLIASAPDQETYKTWTGLGFTNLFYGGSEDFSSLLFSSATPLTSDAPPGGNIYEWSNGELTLASLLPDGSPMPDVGGGEPYGSNGSFNPVSGDGSRAYFASSSAGIFVREGGEMIPISVSHRPGDPATPQPGYLIGTSRDGRYASFSVSSEAGLTPDAPDAPWNVYRYDRQSETLEFAFPSPEYGGVSMSDDGDTLWKFIGNTMRVWRDGVAREVPLSFNGAEAFSAASPNGRLIAISTVARLTEYDNSNPQACRSLVGGGKCREIYVYDFVADTTSCASCPADGSRSIGMAGFGGDRASKEAASHDSPNPISNAGQVFLDTPTALVGGDQNGSRDVYEYQDGEVRLISAGAAGTTANFVDSSVDGRDVFLNTDARLVGQDQDNLFDVYDARVGGGIAAQNPLPPPGGCSGGGDCRGTAGGPPPGVAVGSEDLTGPASASPRAKKRCGQSRRGQKAKRAKARCARKNHHNSPKKGASAR